VSLTNGVSRAALKQEIATLRHLIAALAVRGDAWRVAAYAKGVELMWTMASEPSLEKRMDSAAKVVAAQKADQHALQLIENYRANMLMDAVTERLAPDLGTYIAPVVPPTELARDVDEFLKEHGFTTEHLPDGSGIIAMREVPEVCPVHGGTGENCPEPAPVDAPNYRDLDAEDTPPGGGPDERTEDDDLPF
jgi:hypothetical protein